MRCRTSSPPRYRRSTVALYSPSSRKDNASRWAESGACDPDQRSPAVAERTSERGPGGACSIRGGLSRTRYRDAPFERSPGAEAAPPLALAAAPNALASDAGDGALAGVEGAGFPGRGSDRVAPGALFSLPTRAA